MYLTMEMESFSEYQHLNIGEICRICLLKKDDMIVITEAGIVDMFMECTSIQVTPEDGLYLVCSNCSDEVSRWYNFKQQALRSYKIGKWLLEQQIYFDTKMQQAVESTELNDTQSALIINDPRTNSTSVGKQCAATAQKQFLTIKTYECSKCDKTFKQPQTLTDHMRRHYDSRNYACDVCGKKFYKQFNVTEHKRIHTGERPFVCEYCKRTFTRRLLLRNHIKKAHTGENCFVCQVCNKSFVDGYQLKIHTRTHTGEKPFRCNQCEKAFAMQGQLKSHIKYKHTLEKNFICNICARAFTAKHTLDEHLRTHTGEKKEPRHVCEFCEKKCLTTTQLKIHIRSAHTGERPFSCLLCAKKFITRTSLESHMRTHTGEKSFVCYECGKAFGAKSSLKIHERTHTGERPYICFVCTKSFAQSSTLKSHLKTHSSKE